MPVNIKVILTKDFIRTTVAGVLNFEVSRQALIEMASQMDEPGKYEILVDTREAETVLSVVDIFELGQALADHPSLRRSKLAFLTSISGAKQVEFLETTTANHGIRAKVFTDFEQAITWLVMKQAS
jgi:hypothetical protein